MEIKATTIKAELAFERFAGAIYDTQTADLDMATKIRKLSSDREFFAAGAKGREAPFVSPLQRYTQLRAEVSTFLADLGSLASDLKEAKNPANATPVEATELLTKQVLAMKQQLAALETDDDQKRLLSHSFPIDSSMLQQQALNEQLRQQISKATEAKASAAATTVSGMGSRAPAGSVQYEIYHRPDKSSSTLAGISELDRRVAKLEKLLGQQKDVIGVRYPDVHTAVHYLKRRMELLDKNKLNAISEKIKHLLADMMRLAQATGAAGGGARESKGSATPSGDGSGGKEGAMPTRDEILRHQQKVNSIYSLLNRYQETSEQLPLVINRLKSLRALHEHGATAMSRLQKLQSQQQTVDAVLKQNKEMLTRLDASFKANMETMQKNMSLLQSRFGSLSAQMSKLQK